MFHGRKFTSVLSCETALAAFQYFRVHTRVTCLRHHVRYSSNGRHGMPGFQAVPWGGYQDKMACEHEMKMLTFKNVAHECKWHNWVTWGNAANLV